MDIEFIVLNYLGCNSGRYLSSLAFCAFSVLTRGLPALVVCLAGAVDAGRSPKSPGDGNPRIKGTEEEEGRRGLPRANVMVVPPWLSPCRPGIAPGGVSGINLTPSSSSGVAGLVFPFLEACSAFSVLSLAARARSASSNLVSSLVLVRLYIFFYIIYFRFGIGLGLLIGSFYIIK